MYSKIYTKIKDFVENNFDSLNESEQEKAKEILRKYVNDEKNLYETSKSLEEDDLIYYTKANPQDVATGSEEELKKIIHYTILGIAKVDEKREDISKKS